jgi:serine acetyltransferase
MIDPIKTDIVRNKNNTKGLFFICIFRLSNFCTKNLIFKIIGFPIRFCYKIFIEWFMGIEIPDTTQIGPGFKVMHGQGLIVNNKTIIGANVTLRHNTTIGNTKSGGQSPIISNNVEVGANCVILGNITIGQNSIIGAGSVVVKNIPPYSVVVGNPGKVIKSLNKE